MAEYSLQVSTGTMLHAGTPENLFVTLIGSERESEPILLDTFDSDPYTRKVKTFSVTTLYSIGCLLLLKLEKDPFDESVDRDWFCSKIVVRTPGNEEILFPCHMWLSQGEVVELRGGRATKAFEDNHLLFENQRKTELVEQRLIYKWGNYADGLPRILNIYDTNSIPADVRFSFSKASELAEARGRFGAERLMKGLLGSHEHWQSFEAMSTFSWLKTSNITDIVSRQWRNDDFFGYQFLNGVNPTLIRRCSKLPANFAVTEGMVKPFLAGGTSLAAEMKNGNIFIVDYKILEGVPTRVVDGRPLPLAAALCLLYMNPQKKLMPIAIQLGQKPSEKTPIFLPSDSESDWLLAKLFVRHADTLYSTLVPHLLGTHLVAEVFAMATLRQLPRVHPLHKLLMPHHRHTFHMNILARERLYGFGGVLSNSSLGEDGHIELMRKGLSEMTYTSQCEPENIAARGMESVPNYYYRDDALRLWSIIKGFVQAVVVYYYPSDREVCADSELQHWVNEIFHQGYGGSVDLGFPSSFHAVEELIKFVTMVIFTSSARHAMINNGQLDFFGWIPNGPLLMNQSPPTTKGQSRMEDIFLTLPNESDGSLYSALAALLSRKYSDFVPLGNYPDQRFEEPAVLRMIEGFQGQLSSLSKAIQRRNSELELPYKYLNPKTVENSITI